MLFQENYKAVHEIRLLSAVAVPDENNIIERQMLTRQHQVKKMVENFKNRDLSVIVFHDGEIQIDVSVSPEENTVWLSANQIAELFGRDEKTVRKHINNVFREKEVDKDNNTQKIRVVGVKQPVPFYTLDV